MTVRRLVTAVVATAVVALGAIGAGTFVRLGAQQDAQRRVDHAQRVLAVVGELSDRVNRAGRDPAATARLDQALTEAHRLTAGDPVQRRILAQVRASTAAGDYRRAAELVGAAHDHESGVLDDRIRRNAATARHTRWSLAGCAAAAVLLVVAVGAGAARRIVAAARRVSAAAGRIAAGDLSRPAVVTGPAELAEAARALNTTMSHLSRLAAAEAGRSDARHAFADEREVRGALAGP